MKQQNIRGIKEGNIKCSIDVSSQHKHYVIWHRFKKSYIPARKCWSEDPSTSAVRGMIGSNDWSTQSCLLPCHMRMTIGRILGSWLDIIVPYCQCRESPMLGFPCIGKMQAPMVGSPLCCGGSQVWGPCIVGTWRCHSWQASRSQLHVNLTG